MIYIAHYRGKAEKRDNKLFRFILSRIGDFITRTMTRGPYSHTEICYPLREGKDGSTIYRCYTASIRDKGVRVKEMKLPIHKWDITPITDFYGYDETKHTQETLDSYFNQLMGQPYDLLGALGIITGSAQSDRRWFCSEIVAEYLGIKESWRYHPNLLASLFPIKRI